MAQQSSNNRANVTSYRGEIASKKEEKKKEDKE